MTPKTISIIRKAMALCADSKTKTKIIKKLWKIELKALTTKDTNN